jgi:hypothetical protein
LALTSGKKEKWLSQETWDKMYKRKETKKKMLSTKSNRIKEQLKITYSQQDKDVKRSARTDKRYHIDKLATEAETAAAKKDMKTVYQITKTLSGGYSAPTNTPIRKENGTLTNSLKGQLECWKDHSERVPNRDDPSTEAVITPPTEPLDIDLNPPSLEEVKTVVKIV